MFYKKTVIYAAAVLLVCVFVNTMAPAATAAEGFTQEDLITLVYDPKGSRKYTVVSRTELGDYSESGSIEVRPNDGAFDSRGETFHVCICCYASHVDYDAENEGRPVWTEMKPSKKVLSYTANELDEKIRFDSEKAEYDLITECGSNMQSLWQIEADGDCNYIISYYGHNVQFY